MKEKKKSKNKSKPVQRSLGILRDNGWTVTIVERYIRFGNMPFGQRFDAYGFGDLLACRPKITRECENCRGSGRTHVSGRRFMQECHLCHQTGRIVVAEKAIALVQCCRDADLAEHRTKILGINEFYTWKQSGGRVFLQGWSLKGARGQKKRWTMREVEL